MENNDYQPPKKIAVGLRRDTSLSGEPVCPACKNAVEPGAKFCGGCGQDLSKPAEARPRPPNAPPAIFIGKSRQNSGKGNLSDSIQRVVVVVVLLIGAYYVVQFVHQHYKQGEGITESQGPGQVRSDRGGGQPVQIDLYEQCASVAKEVLAPMDAYSRFSTSTLSEIATKATQIGDGAEADRVRSAVRAFSDEAGKVWAQREMFRLEIEQEKTKKPSTLNKDEREQARVRDFAVQAVTRRWQEYVGRERTVLGELLAAIGKNKTEMGTSKFLPSKPCELCKGAGRVICTTCKGKGMVPGKASVACKSCNGTGSYKTGLSKTATRCPFCKGTGRSEVETSVVCSACGNLGQIACPTCSKPADH